MAGYPRHNNNHRYSMPQIPGSAHNPQYMYHAYAGYQPPFPMTYPNQSIVPQTPLPTPYPTTIGQTTFYIYPQYPTIYTPPGFEWVSLNSMETFTHADKAIVAGTDVVEHSPIWVVRCHFKNSLIPGKLTLKHYTAYIGIDGKEITCGNVEVLCCRPENYRWVDSGNGYLPNNAVPAGYTNTGEILFIGRVRHEGSMIPGRVHPSRRSLFITHAGKEITYEYYDILVYV